MLGGLGVPTRVDARPPHSEGPAGAVAKRERFAHRPRWGANVRSRELQAAPWLTRGPGGAIRRGSAFTRDVAPSCEGACGGRDSLFANRTSWWPETRARNGATGPETLALSARGGELVNNSGRVGAQVVRVSNLAPNPQVQRAVAPDQCLAGIASPGLTGDGQAVWDADAT